MERCQIPLAFYFLFLCVAQQASAFASLHRHNNIRSRISGIANYLPENLIETKNCDERPSFVFGFHFQRKDKIYVQFRLN